MAWLIGRIVTDRYHWSQWLWWIPTPVTLPVILLGMAGSLRRAPHSRIRTRRIRRWLAVAAVAFIYFAVFEHRLLHRAAPLPPPNAALKIMHWNAQPPTWADMEPSVDFITSVDADITILTNPAGLFEHERCQPWMAGQQSAGFWPFSIASRLPILSVRPLIAVDRTYVVLFELDTTEKLGRTLRIYLVDLPSNPGVGRMALAKRVRGMLDGLNVPPPDVVIGDFNITRGSDSIETMFPSMRYAFDEAGHGYGATYHRRWPFQHLDHVLLSAPISVWRYDLADPGRGRHRAQLAWIAAVK